MAIATSFRAGMFLNSFTFCILAVDFALVVQKITFGAKRSERTAFLGAGVWTCVLSHVASMNLLDRFLDAWRTLTRGQIFGGTVVYLRNLGLCKIE